jgi:hypothetical protein
MKLRFKTPVCARRRNYNETMEDTQMGSARALACSVRRPRRTHPSTDLVKRGNHIRSFDRFDPVRWFHSLPGGEDQSANISDLGPSRTFSNSTNCFRKFGVFPAQDRPEGTSENSPAFRRREAGPEVSSPEGTVEPGSLASLFQPSLRDFRQHRIGPGVETPGYSHPVPFGTKFHEFPYCISLNAV